MPKSKITVKEAKLIKGIAEGKTKQRAAMEAYNASTPESASSIASYALKKVDVQEALQIALRKHGITLDQAIAPIGKALNATKVQITGQGDQAFAEVVEDIDLQLKGSDRALKLMGIGQQEGGNTFNFINIAERQRQKYDI
jgi:hypothetical protein